VTSWLIALYVVEVVESYERVESGGGAIEATIIYLRIVLLELNKSMVDAVRVVFAILIR
jgi:hypothetical protein